jgi:hypothetical protein
MGDIIADKAEEKVEITEPEAAPDVVSPTRAELKERGWGAVEIDLAEKRGMVKKEEEKKPETKKEDIPVEKVEEKKEEPKVEEKPKSSLPDFEITDPAKEKAFLEAFGAGTPQRAMYFRMKNERQSRQRAQADLQAEKVKAAALEARLAALEGKKSPVVDENGNEIDPDDRPLTLKQLKEMQKAEQEAFEKQQQENHARAQSVTEAQKVQEDYTREIYPDFDDTLKKAAEVMQNLDTMIPEKWKQAKAVKLIRELQVAAANADKMDLDEYHGPMIAYEIGQLHPSYGKTNGKEPKKEEREVLKDPKANGSLTPEQMKRIEENNSRRVSSASITGGGGKRTIDAEDVGLAELNAMNYLERQNFRDKHPNRYAKLLRS